MGIGAFHRAHQALVIDDCLNAGSTDWGIIAASLRSSETRDALAPQDFLYTVAVNDCADRHLRVVGSVLDVIVAPENPERLIEALSDSCIKIVSLTITEKGYLRGAFGQLDLAHADVQYDLNNRQRPITVFGFLAAALARRKLAGVQAFTVLCCDNLLENGATFKKLLLQFVEKSHPELVDFVRDQVACPSTMVDRIVPATTESDRADVSRQIGVSDAWPVVTEPFLSWIIEDKFPAGRPNLGTPGIIFVHDVTPYELMKLRLLNGAHVALPSGELDPAEFTVDLTTRFSNTALHHWIEQIATDGSQKLPQRILAPARQIVASGQQPQALFLSLACWIEAVRLLGTGAAFNFSDPNGEQLIEIARSKRDDATAVAGMLSVIGLDARSIETSVLQAGVTAAWRRIRRVGPTKAIESVAADEI